MTSNNTPNSVTLPTNQKAALYIRQAAARQTKMGKDLRELNTQLLIDFAHEQGWCDENLVIFNDSGIPASAPLAKREGLQQMFAVIEAGEIKSVLLYAAYSLFRNANPLHVSQFIAACRKHCVLVVTLQRVYDFSDEAQTRLFRFEVEEASFMIYTRTTRRRRGTEKQKRTSSL